MATASKWNKGIQLIQRGCDKHEQGDKKSAATFYERGIQLLLDHVKTMPQSQRKMDKQQQIESYLTLLADLRPNNNNNDNNNNNYKRSSQRQQFKQNKRKYNNNNNTNTNNNNNKRQQKQHSKYDQELYDRIENEIINNNLNVSFSDVVGLDNVKQALLEAVILPSQRPDIFIGPRAPPKGLLLFGPPGNGKTFIAKALASECNATFFSISSSTLTSKYVGQGEKLVRVLFECARNKAPSIIFIDEIDSILTSRGGDNEQESSRRMKTEFLIQFDGVQSDNNNNNKGRVLLIGATNLPWELDDAALRRFPKRILVNKPDNKQRGYLIKKILYASNNKLNVKISDKQLNEIIELTQGYSASDIKNLVNDAAMGPIRDVGMDILNKKNNIPPITIKHFKQSLQNIKPSTTKQAQLKFEKWDNQFGTKLMVKKHKNNDNNNINKSKSWFSMFQ